MAARISGIQGRLQTLLFAVTCMEPVFRFASACIHLRRRASACIGQVRWGARRCGFTPSGFSSTPFHLFVPPFHLFVPPFHLPWVHLLPRIHLPFDKAFLVSWSSIDFCSPSIRLRSFSFVIVHFHSVSRIAFDGFGPISGSVSHCASFHSRSVGFIFTPFKLDHGQNPKARVEARRAVNECVKTKRSEKE